MNTLAPYLKAALVADSLSLGSHWIYNQAKIARTYPDGIYTLTQPLAPYHKGKEAGDLTHYGDQTLWLQASITQNNNYSPEAWKALWLERVASYTGYKDSASNDTFKQNAQSPSASNDLAGASRIAPILDLNLPLEETIQAARSQTLLTHGDLYVVDSAEFFVRAVFAIKAGSNFTQAFEIAAQNGHYQTLVPSEHLVTALEADPSDHLTVSSAMGLTCHFPEAFPLTLYYAIHFGSSFSDCMSANALAGGDTSARAMLLALLFVAQGESSSVESLAEQLNSTDKAKNTEPTHFEPGSHSLQIESPNGILAGVIEIPAGEISACAIFAHCFTCGKDYLPEKKITQALAANGIATLRVDFSGLGQSAGEFENSSFLTNLEDIYAAANWLKENYKAPQLLVGHSLGGTAVLAAAGKIESINAIATIGSPADPAHILHMLTDHLQEIEQQGSAQVSLAGRNFTVSQRFVDDAKSYDYIKNLNALEGHKLIMHSPIDETVDLKNAGEIYTHLKHPKSFIALDGANHLLTDQSNAKYSADMIAIWAKKVLGA